MSLLKIRAKFILQEIIFLIPSKKRLAIIENSKVLNEKLEYLPLTYNKLSNFVELKTDEFFESKENKVKIVSDDTILKIASKIKINISPNFKDLLREILIEVIKAKDIYYLTDSTIIKKYQRLNEYKFNKNIIKFDDEFCKLIDDGFIFNKDEIYGISIKIADIKNINKLKLLKKIFKNIQYFELDFCDFFNNFNDLEIKKIFSPINKFAKNNPIKILVFQDNTERTWEFTRQFENFSSYLIYLDKVYFTKYFNNSESKAFITTAHKNNDEDILSEIESPNLIINNYFNEFSDKIKILNMNISNPCDIEEKSTDGSFIDLATRSEGFSSIGRFKNLEEFVLSYSWKGSPYFPFDSEQTLAEALGNLKKLKNIVFKGNIYLLKTLSLLNVENAYFISHDDIDYFEKNESYIILNTEMLNNIKNLEINLFNECLYKNKTLKLLTIDDIIELNENYPGMKNIEELNIIITGIDIYDLMKIEKNVKIENLIKCTCKQKNNLRKIVIDYLRCDISKIIEILCDYCMSYNTLKNIELTGIVEPKDINKVLDNIIKIKNQKVDIIIKILDNNIKEIISNNEQMKNALSFENVYMEIKISCYTNEKAIVKLIQIK